MTVKEAYKNYYQYCRDTETWTWDFIKDNLKKSWIDYEEYNFEEFKDKILTDDKFNERWANGCTRELSLEERAKWLQDTKGYDLLVGNLEHDHIREVVENESPTRTIID